MIIPARFGTAHEKRVVNLFWLFLGIILAFSKRTPDEIAEAIRNFNIELTSIEFVQHLIQYLPNDDEVHIALLLFKNTSISL